MGKQTHQEVVAPDHAEHAQPDQGGGEERRRGLIRISGVMGPGDVAEQGGDQRGQGAVQQLGLPAVQADQLLETLQISLKKRKEMNK